MKKLLASALCVALALTTQPVSLVAAALKAQQPANVGEVSGHAMVDGKPLANVTVRLRNVDTGELVGSTTASASGEFSFTGLSAGNLIVETVSGNGVIIGASAAITLAAGAMVAANLTVGTSAAALAAAGGVGAAAGAVTGGLTTATAAATAGGAAAAGAAGGIGAVLGSTVGLVTISAVTVGITAGVVATQNDASASQ